MRTLLLLCLLAVGCTRAGPMEQGSRGTPDAHPPPAEAQSTAEPEKRPASKPEPPAPSAAAQSGACTSDADCALTRVDENGQCENLCTPRAVPRAQAADLQKKAREHEARQPCPDFPCAPPRSLPEATCVQGQCAVRHVNPETR